MRRRSLTVVLGAVLALFPVLALAVPASPLQATVPMRAQNGSDQSGTAVLTSLENGSTIVSITIGQGAAGVAQPAYIYVGTYGRLNPVPTYPLAPVIGGRSETIVNTPVTEITSRFGVFYTIIVLKSAQEPTTTVSCGRPLSRHLRAGVPLPGLPRTGAGGLAPASATP